MRQLSRRNPRRHQQARRSIASDAAILGPEGDQKSFQMNGGRSRSLSASSAILLNRQNTGDPRRSVGLDSVSASGAALNQGDSESAPYTPSNGRAASAFSYLPGASQASGHGGSGGAGIVNLRNAEAADPYYRPPRARRLTADAYTPGPASRGSWNSADWANRRWSHHSPANEGSPNRIESFPLSGRGTPVPAHLGGTRERSDSNAEDPRRSKTDYATREVDFYYGVRGPALSNLPTRRLKTGPADPTGPVSSATGWLKSLFGGKTKDTGKGFEVVRSSRALQPNSRTASRALALDEQVPYSDDPSAQPAIERNRALDLSDDGDAIGGGTRHLPQEDEPSPLDSDDERDMGRYNSEDEIPSANRESQVSPFPPSLPTIETGGGIELPSRVPSRASSTLARDNTRDRRRPPNVPRKSSRRHSPYGDLGYTRNESVRLSTIPPSPQTTPQRSTRLYDPDQPIQGRLEPPETSANRLPFESHSDDAQDDRLSGGGQSSTKSSLLIPTDDGPPETTGRARHSSSVLGSLAPDLRSDRPQSMGYVQQHRTSDNIHTASPDDPPYVGSSAEVVNEIPRRSVSPDVRYRPP